MKIALIGYGKMGKTIEQIALNRGHQIVSIVDINNPEEFQSANFKSADVAIEFTTGHGIRQLYEEFRCRRSCCFRHDRLAGPYRRDKREM